MAQTHAVNASGEMKPLRPLKVALAGLGVGGAQIIPAMDRMAEVELVAAADVRPQALKTFEERFGGRGYDSVEALCADPDVEVVWVATPNNLHHDHVLMAANAGKHVVCEKPMALSVAEAEEMVEVCEKNGVKLLCGHTYSLNPSIQAMRQVVASGELGQLIQVSTWLYTDWLLKPRMPEELDEVRGGGVVYRHGPHVIDTIRLLGGGMVRSVRGMVGRWMKERPAPGNFTAYLEFEDGTPASIAYSGYGYFYTADLTWGIGSRLYSDEQAVVVRRQLRAGEADVEADKEAMRFGVNNRAEADRSVSSPGEMQVGSPPPPNQRWFGITLASCERGDVRQSPNGLYVYGDEGRREIPVESGHHSGNAELSELYHAVREGTPISHDGRWGMATLEVQLAVMQSARERREIMLTHQSPVR
jgi:phthalate 4,5-cis-dihydrodiol dehydrogenase